MVSAHSIEVPSLAKHIEEGMESVRCLGPAKGPVLAHAALRNQPASNNSFVISKPRYIEVGFNRVPLHLKCWVVHELAFDLIVFVTGSDQRFVIAMLN